MFKICQYTALILDSYRSFYPHFLEFWCSRGAFVSFCLCSPGMWPRRTRASITVKHPTRKRQSSRSQPSYFQLVLYANICSKLNCFGATNLHLSDTCCVSRDGLEFHPAAHKPDGEERRERNTHLPASVQSTHSSGVLVQKQPTSYSDSSYKCTAQRRPLLPQVCVCVCVLYLTNTQELFGASI